MHLGNSNSNELHIVAFHQNLWEYFLCCFCCCSALFLPSSLWKVLQVNKTWNLMETYVGCFIVYVAKQRPGCFRRKNFCKNSMTLTNLFICKFEAVRLFTSHRFMFNSYQFSSVPFQGVLLFAWSGVFAEYLNGNHIYTKHTTEWMRCWFCITIFDLTFRFKTYAISTRLMFENGVMHTFEKYVRRAFCVTASNFDVESPWVKIANWTWMKWTQGINKYILICVSFSASKITMHFLYRLSNICFRGSVLPNENRIRWKQWRKHNDFLSKRISLNVKCICVSSTYMNMK